jgi:hypothetical protein
MNVLILKLVTGEDVLGEVIKNTEVSVTLKNVVGVTVVRGQNGQPNVGLTPFPLHAEPESGIEREFKKEHIVYEYVPAEDFIKNYDQIFGTGLVMPETKKLVLG